MNLRRIKTAYNFTKKYGITAFFRFALTKLRSTLGRPLSKIKIIEHYEFVKINKIGNPVQPESVAKDTLNWVIPPFGFGSGGHLNIFRFIHYLEKQGFVCRVIIVGDLSPSSEEAARKQINEWFFQLNATVYIGMDKAPPSYITLATSWQTAYYVRNFQPTIHKCYFVQDFEPYFYAAGAEYAWAENTYKFGFWGITAGKWLEEKLAAEYGMRTSSFSFSYDTDRYTSLPRRNPQIKHIFFYARPPTQRRAFELGLLVLDNVTRQMPGIRVIFAGWDVSDYKIPFEHLNAGVVSLDELTDLYSQCDLALVLSFSNLSLLPLELMACGVPVVSNRANCTEWLLNDDIACLAEPTVEHLAEALINLLNNRDELQRLREAGLNFVAKTDWPAEAAKVGAFLHGLSIEPLREN